MLYLFWALSIIAVLVLVAAGFLCLAWAPFRKFLDNLNNYQYDRDV